MEIRPRRNSSKLPHVPRMKFYHRFCVCVFVCGGTSEINNVCVDTYFGFIVTDRMW